MTAVRSRSRVPIRLTSGRWSHVAARHPELAGERDRVLETLSQPDVVQRGDHGELLAVRHYETNLLPGKHLVGAYREISPNGGFVLTAYFTRRPSAQREAVWKR